MTTIDNLQDADGTLEEQKNNTTENQTPQEEVKNVEKQQHSQTDIEVEVSELKSVKQSSESSEETTEVQDSEVESKKIDKINKVKDFNYEDMSLESLISEFEQLLKNDDIYSIRPKVNAIKKIFNQKFSIILNEKKEAFLAEGGNSIDFSFDSPIKKKI